MNDKIKFELLRMAIELLTKLNKQNTQTLQTHETAIEILIRQVAELKVEIEKLKGEG